MLEKDMSNIMNYFIIDMNIEQNMFSVLYFKKINYFLF